MQFVDVKVLLIEDSPEDADLLQEMLWHGKKSIAISLSFKHVERLQDAIAALNTEKFDVVLADLSLPDAQGLDAVQQITALKPDLAIVVMTGLDDEVFALEAVRQGAQDYLVKGQISYHLLVRAIRYAIERVQTQKLLRETLDKFRNLVETTSDCVWEMNVECKYTYVSPKVYDILGYAPEEIIGKSCFDFMPSEEAHKLYPIWQDILASRLPFRDLEYLSTHKSQHHVFVETNGAPFFSSDGTLLGYRGVDRDITARKQSEILLRESEQRLQAILDNTTAIIYICDLEGRFILINRQYEKLFNINRESVKNLTPYDIFPLEIAREFALNNQKVFEANQALTLEEVAPHPDGLHTYVSVKFPLFDENNCPYAICGISTDITERRKAEEETKRALDKERELSELRSEFVSMVSHEFRTPLSSILLSADLLKNKALEWPEEKVQMRFHRIKQAVKRMTELLEDVLTVSKAEAGKIEFNPTSIDVEDFCMEIIEELQNSVNSSHVFRFTSHCHIKGAGVSSLEQPVLAGTEAYNLEHGEVHKSNAPATSYGHRRMPSVYLDERLLRHILTNLLSNAVKYSPSGGVISVELIYTTITEFPISSNYEEELDTNPNENVLVIKVQDTGIGILPEDREHLFESFHRGKNIGTISGTGLGLVIVKKAVDLHGGKIMVDSEVDKGTTFTVILPV